MEFFGVTNSKSKIIRDLYGGINGIWGDTNLEVT
jgi:hypothetical protein